jgi:hypothetical protein
MEYSTVRKWLKENDYDDVLSIIDEIMNEWHRDGKKTRRSWWEVLAGDKNGKPKKIYGKEIPVLRAAQIREGRLVTPNAICKNVEEKIEPKRITNRWPPKSKV